MTETPTVAWNKVRVRDAYTRFNNAGIGTNATITFTPEFDQIRDTTTGVTVIAEPIIAALTPEGLLDVLLPGTNDRDTDRLDWTYKVKENFPGGLEYHIRLPLESPEVVLRNVKQVAASPGAVVVQREGGDQFTVGQYRVNISDVGTADEFWRIYNELTGDEIASGPMVEGEAVGMPSVVLAYYDLIYRPGSIALWDMNGEQQLVVATDRRLLDTLPPDADPAEIPPFFTDTAVAVVTVPIPGINSVQQNLFNGLPPFPPEGEPLPENGGLFAERFEIRPGVWGSRLIRFDPASASE